MIDCCFKRENVCAALTVSKCPDKCAFYKTAEQHNKDKAKADARLRSLSLAEQQNIADKYYGGKKMW